MSTTKTAEKAQTAKANNKTTLKKAEDVKPQEAKSNTTIKDIVNPTAQSRIQKIKNFEILANKFSFLENKKQELEQFIISNDGTKEKLTLSNVNGYKFEVSNSQVLEKVVELLDTELTTFLEKSEKEILAYSI
tara:strand:+ start:246 stop:644 length:399 start_codon:yes stop_codon:yes gene_type:complete